MNTQIFEQAGTRMLSTVVTLGRMQTETLQNLAKATGHTPFAPFFAVQAEMSRVTVDGVEKLIGAQDTPVASSKPVVEAEPLTKAEPVAKADPVAKPAAPMPAVKPAPAREVVAAPVKVVPAAVADESEVDDLSLINGIGPATARKLNDAGIENFADLASRDADDLAGILAASGVKMTRFSPADWIAEAKTFTSPA